MTAARVGPTPAVRNPSIVELRVARIARLLIELEELTRLPRNVPPTTLDQARAGLEKARRIVRPWTAVDRQQQEDDLDGDPQPELDDERRRYYRITPFGTSVARAETSRLTSLLKLARASGFRPERL